MILPSFLLRSLARALLALNPETVLSATPFMEVVLHLISLKILKRHWH